MAEKIKKLETGELEITNTPDAIVSTMTREEIVDRQRDAVVAVNRAEADLSEAEAEAVKWDNYLKEINK